MASAIVTSSGQHVALIVAPVDRADLAPDVADEVASLIEGGATNIVIEVSDG